LDAEIAAAAPTATTAGESPVAPTLGPADLAAPATPEEAEALAQARAEAINAPAEARRGCWIVFAGAFVLLFAAIAAWFVVRYVLGPGP
jgi:hypothetical protein